MGDQRTNATSRSITRFRTSRWLCLSAPRVPAKAASLEDGSDPMERGDPAVALHAVEANIIEMPVADETVVFRSLNETHRDLRYSPIMTGSRAFRSPLSRVR